MPDEVDEDERRRRAVWWIVVAAAVVAVGVAVGIAVSTSVQPVTGRGEVLRGLPSADPEAPTAVPTPTASADGTPVVDGSGVEAGSAVEQVWAGARSGVGVKALSRSGCLDGAAAEYAGLAARAGGAGARPAVPEVSCGDGVTLGYMLGFDESGVAQAMAALTVTSDGPSPLVSEDAREVGYAIAASRGSTGDVNGYVLAWAVSE